MTYGSKVLLLCPAVIAGVTALLYAVTRQRQSTDLLGDIHNCLKENVAQTALYIAPSVVNAAPSTTSTATLYQ
jgi:hypothetical protein